MLSTPDGDSFFEDFLNDDFGSLNETKVGSKVGSKSGSEPGPLAKSLLPSKKENPEEFSVLQLDNVQEIRRDALTLYNRGNYEGALSKIEDAIRVLPGDLELNYFQAQCLFRLGNLNRVEVILKNLMKMDESADFIQLPRMLAYTLLKEEKLREADKFLREAMMSYPDDMQLKHMFGFCCERQKKYQMAEAMFNQILNVEPDHPNAHNSLAYVYYLQKKELHAASMHVQRALAHNQNNPAYLDTYGVILGALGDMAAARTMLQKALKIAPKNKVIQDHINNLGKE